MEVGLSPGESGCGRYLWSAGTAVLLAAEMVLGGLFRLYPHSPPPAVHAGTEKQQAWPGLLQFPPAL